MTFAGSPDRVEARLVPDAGYEFDAFRISGFPRKPGLPLARALGRAVAAPAACTAIIRRRRPDAVLGAGGYVAGPMVLAAALLRIPTALTEADAHLGLANRLASPFARRVYLAYPVEGRTGDRYEVVGRPIPARARPVAQVDARQLFGLPQHGQVVLVAGALAGATALNEFAVETFGTRGPAVLHITGERDFAAISARVSRPEYRVIATTDQIGAAYAAADLAITRAGSSVWEIAAAGTPAIFVPYPYATADHQAKNAQHFVRAGGALMVREAELATVPALARELLADETRLQAMHDAMLTAARPQAADVIAEGLIELARA